jgi:hypothetical protein
MGTKSNPKGLLTVQNNRLIFKSAASIDLDKINREVIDSVKFRFLNKGIKGSTFR